jgi:hypothetical protein
VTISRDQVLNFRVRAHQLDRDRGNLSSTAVLDFGVQDTGPDGGLWALAIRGVDVSKLDDDVATLWTIRGAPHLYRRKDLGKIAAAVDPYSDEDAGKRIYDATKPLKAAGISNVEALDAVAAAMRKVVTKPMVKGEVSTKVTKLMDEPYLRECRPCKAIHLYEMPFRLAAFRAGLELQPGTSPPVLQRIPNFRPAKKVDERFDLIRAYLRLLGPATPKHVADFLDSPLKEIKSRWPDDVVEVTLGKEKRWVLAGDEKKLAAKPAKATRLLGPYDLFLQAKDRPLLVGDPKRAKALWPVLGRPGAILHDGEIAGMWRPRQSGGKLTVAVEPWIKVTKAVRDAITEQAERLAAYRKVQLTKVDTSI